MAASLGICDCGATVTNQIEYQICASEKLNETKTIRTVSTQASPKELCRFYANGTIDVPTLTIIEAYVDLNSRTCIGDEPISTSNNSSLQTQLRDFLFASSSQAFATWLPGGEIEIDEPAVFFVRFDDSIQQGNLLGRQASIRFQAAGHRWEFSDGTNLFGRDVEKTFTTEGAHTAVARVKVRVDYRFGSEDWVQNSFQAELKSNLLELGVVERPRRSLLVEG